MKLKDPTINLEANHAPIELTDVKVMMWELFIKHYLSREWKLRGNIQKNYAIVLVQFTKPLRLTLKSDPVYKKSWKGLTYYGC